MDNATLRQQVAERDERLLVYSKQMVKEVATLRQQLAEISDAIFQAVGLRSNHLPSDVTSLIKALHGGMQAHAEVRQQLAQAQPALRDYVPQEAITIVAHLRAQVDEQHHRAEAAEATVALLRPYARHAEDCPQAMAPSGPGPHPAIALGPCNCGLDAALAGLPK